MKLTYDPRYNVAYIHLKEKTAEVETAHISEELNIDLAPDGTVYGIKLLNANEQLMPTPNGKLIVVNPPGFDSPPLGAFCLQSLLIPRPLAAG